MSEKLLSARPYEFFLELVLKAWRHQGLREDELLEIYLAKVLDCYVSLDEERKEMFYNSLALFLLENLDVSSRENFRKQWKVGDTALMIAGVFPERNFAMRKNTGRDYYESIARSAYGNLFSNMPRVSSAKDFLVIFGKLSENPKPSLKVLSDIARNEIFRPTIEVAAKRYLESGEKDDLRWLQEQGILIQAFPKKGLLQ